MEASDAREHLEMIEKIIAASSRKLEVGGEFFVAWGLYGTVVNVVSYLVFAGRIPSAAFWWVMPALAGAIAFTIVRSRYYRRVGTRMSLLQREYLNVLWLTISVSFLACLLGFNIFNHIAQSAVWSVGESLVLLYIGMHGNRRAQIGGILLLASLALANFIPQYDGLFLAGGALFGYAGFGVADMLSSE